MNHPERRQDRSETPSESAPGRMIGADVATRPFAYGSEAYEQSLRLRDVVLRRPLGRSIADDDLSGDAEALHIGAFAEERLVGTLMLRPKGAGVFQMKQVAVDESLRGMNVGRKLVEAAEASAIAEGGAAIILHARKLAIVFYEKMGYAREGEPFEEMGIPHARMTKKLV